MIRSWIPLTSGWARTVCSMASTSSGLGLWPRRGSRVSLAAPQPERRMKTATSRPTQPSTLEPVKRNTRVPSSTAEVATTSERESAAVAAMAAEPMRRPRRRLKPDIHSFTRMEARGCPADSQEKATSSGWRDLLHRGLGQLHPHQQDGRRHDEAGQVLDAPVAEGVVVVGLFGGQPEARQGHHRGARVRQVVEGVGGDGDGAGEHARQQLPRREEQVEHDAHQPESRP